jgi:hypothetical protein
VEELYSSGSTYIDKNISAIFLFGVDATVFSLAVGTIFSSAREKKEIEELLQMNGN